jgi:DNA-binding LacI/PurR family transcriptional regulator
VLVDEELTITGPRCGFVGVDNRDGGRLAARHLIDGGHRRLAAIAGPESLPTAAARLEGFLAEVARAGLDEPEVEAAGSYVFEDGRAAFAALHHRGVRFDALFCANDLLALGAITAAQDAGLRVPGDLSVVGFDDIFFAGLSNPGLTTVAQPKRLIGGEAARLLIDLIEGRRAEPRRILPVRLTERASTRPGGGVR